MSYALQKDRHKLTEQAYRIRAQPLSNLHSYAARRGELLEDFLKTHNAPDALYSVASKQEGSFEK